jgi:ketosteroid isomerase-like protein
MRPVLESKEDIPVKTVLTIALLSCLAYGFQSRVPAPQVSEDVNEVKKALAALTEVQLKYDANAVDKLLDRAFVYVANDGSLVSRADFIKYTDRERNPLDLLEVTDVSVTTSGDTAIATGLIHEKGLVDGKPYEFRGRTLITYVRKNGRWLCLAIHD